MKPLYQRRWVCALLASSVTGCAIQTPHLAIRNWPVSQRAMYYHEAEPYRLVVLPLTDQRPPHERSGQRAPGMFLLVWNRRVGDYYTGDRVFGGEVTGQLSTQLAVYLQAANTFTHVVTIPAVPGAVDFANSASVRQLGDGHAADLLLRGELRHFFGSQHQHFSMFALPLYFINAFGWQDSKSLPWGQTTLQCALYDGRSGDMLWRRELEASETLPRDTDSMAVAAMRSFATVAGELATELRKLPLDTLQAPADGSDDAKVF